MKFDDAVDERYGRLSKEYQNLDETTKEVLVAYCKALTLYDEAVETVASDGIIMENEKGKLVEHPMVGAMHKLSNEVKGLYTPLKRILFKQQDQAEADEFDEFLGM